jgi:hypothetical protein
MITFLFTLIPFVFIIYYLTTISKSKYVSSDLKSGEICYSCKEKMDIDRLEVLENLLNNKSNYRLCQSCKRDEKLDEIVNHSKLSKLNKFKLYLISDSYDKFFKILLILLLIFCITDVTLKVVFNIKGFSYFYNTFLVCYWLLLIYRHKLISIKK